MSELAGLEVHVLMVSATPGRSDSALGQAVASALEASGHRVADESVVSAEAGQVREAVRVIAASGASALLIVGGSTAFEGHVTQAALAPVLCPRFPGFATLFTQLWHARAGSQAVWAEVVAGLVGRTATFALPPSAEAIDLAIRSLIGPQLAAAVGAGATVGQAVPAPPAAAEVAYDLSADPVTQEAVFEEIPEAASDDDDEEAPAPATDEPPPLPPPSGGLGALGRRALSFELSPEAPAEAPDDDDPAAGRDGWLRAVRELEGKVHLDQREELPQPVEKLAPLLDVLHNAGETGVLELPSGVRYSLWGYPDLRRPGSKVLAVGWGRPLIELLALHRFPVQTGTCIDQPHGLLPHASDSVEATGEAITGVAPPDTDGELFAVDATSVWVLREGRVHRFDGRRDREMGTPKQALATLALSWSVK